MRVDDVELSFVFDRLPVGAGDLVVRMHLQTELPPVGDGETLDLLYGDRGSVHIGAVTGIDARGMRAKGTVRYVDGMLELGLPADFVDSATLPLMLDPSLGSEIQISNIDVSGSWTTRTDNLCLSATFVARIRKRGVSSIMWETSMAKLWYPFQIR